MNKIIINSLLPIIILLGTAFIFGYFLSSSAVIYVSPTPVFAKLFIISIYICILIGVATYSYGIGSLMTFDRCNKEFNKFLNDLLNKLKKQEKK